MANPSDTSHTPLPCINSCLSPSPLFVSPSGPACFPTSCSCPSLLDHSLRPHRLASMRQRHYSPDPATLRPSPPLAPTIPKAFDVSTAARNPLTSPIILSSPAPIRPRALLAFNPLNALSLASSDKSHSAHIQPASFRSHRVFRPCFASTTTLSSGLSRSMTDSTLATTSTSDAQVPDNSSSPTTFGGVDGPLPAFPVATAAAADSELSPNLGEFAVTLYNVNVVLAAPSLASLKLKSASNRTPKLFLRIKGAEGWCQDTKPVAVQKLEGKLRFTLWNLSEDMKKPKKHAVVGLEVPLRKGETSSSLVPIEMELWMPCQSPVRRRRHTERLLAKIALNVECLPHNQSIQHRIDFGFGLLTATLKVHAPHHTAQAAPSPALLTSTGQNNKKIPSTPSSASAMALAWLTTHNGDNRAHPLIQTSKNNSPSPSFPSPPPGGCWSASSTFSSLAAMPRLPSMTSNPISFEDFSRFFEGGERGDGAVSSEGLSDFAFP